MKTRTVLSTVGAVLCVALIVYLWWPWIALKTAPVREAARPGPKQDEVFPLRIDLVTAPTDTPLQLTVPARKTFAVELVNRAPGVDYFWKLTVPQYPSFYTRIQRATDWDAHESQQRAWPCPSLAPPWRNLLETTREEQVHARIEEVEQALVQAPQTRGCSNLTGMIKSRLEWIVGGDRTSRSALPPGAKGVLAVEKRDPSTGAVLKTWTVAIEAEGREQGWAFQEEQAWLVGETAHDIAAMVLSDKERGPQHVVVRCVGGSGHYRITIKLGPEGRVILDQYGVTLREHAWSPLTYVDLARALAGQRADADAGQSETSTGGSPNVVTRLLDLDVQTLLGENQRLSSLLREHPLDANVQEQAALLAAAFALREAAGTFSDVRRELSGITAHLTLAQIGRSGGVPSSAGVVAAIALDALGGREVPALEALKNTPSSSGVENGTSLEAWKRALTMRITGDWRLLKQIDGSTPMERYEYLRAILRTRGDLEGLAVLERLTPAPSAQWLRAFVQGNSSVEAFNFVRRTLLADEVAEAAAVLGLRAEPSPTMKMSPTMKTVAETVAANEEMGHFEPPHPLEVLDRGVWARRTERNLANAIGHLDYGLSSTLGDEEGETSFRREVQDLTSLPLVEGSLEQQAYDRWRAMAATPMKRQDGSRAAGHACTRIPLELRTRPERVSAAAWQALARVCPRAVTLGEFPLWELWFSPALLRVRPTTSRNGLECPRWPLGMRSRISNVSVPFRTTATRSSMRTFSGGTDGSPRGVTTRATSAAWPSITSAYCIRGPRPFRQMKVSTFE